MTLLGTRERTARPMLRGPERTLDARRVGVRALGRVDTTLAVAARLAEADRLLPQGLHLLLLAGTRSAASDRDGTQPVARVRPGPPPPASAPAAQSAASSTPEVVDVTLVDQAGDPVWMGSLPMATDAADAATGLPAAHDHETDRRLRALAHAMSAVGFVRRTPAWFRWEL